MAAGGDANWRVARDEGLQQRLLQILCKWLEAQDMGEKDLDGIVEGQPLWLCLLRTPHVFEERLRWPLDNQSGSRG